MTSKPHKEPDDNFDSIYPAMNESNMRLRYWVNRIYAQHDGRDPLGMGDPRTEVFQKPTVEWTNILVSLRYLILEMWNFNKLYNSTYAKVIKKLRGVDTTKLHKLIDEYGQMAHKIRDMRNKFAVHPELPFVDVDRIVAGMGLDSIMFYARTIIALQDAVFEIISRKDNSAEAMMSEPAQIPIDLATRDVLECLNKRYRSIKVLCHPIMDSRTCLLSSDSCLSLQVLYAYFKEYKQGRAKKINDAHRRFPHEVYNVKYMILELCTFIEVYEKMGVCMTSKPEFMQRKKKYYNIRHNYCGHTRPKKFKSFEHVLEKNKEFLRNLVLDIEEIGLLYRKLESVFPRQLTGDPSEAYSPGHWTEEVSSMTKEEMDNIEKKVKNKRAVFDKFLNK